MTADSCYYVVLKHEKECDLMNEHGGKWKWEASPQTAARKLGMGRLAIGLLAAILVAGALGAWWLVVRTDHEMRENLLARTKLVAGAVNLERIQTLTGTATDLESPDYLRLKAQFGAIRAVEPGCRFIYMMGKRPDGTVFFFVDDRPVGHEEEAPAGMIYDDVPAGFKRVLATGIASVEGPFTDKWGSFVSGCVPLNNPVTGKVLAILAMDIDARHWKTDLAKAGLPVGLAVLALIAIIFIGAFLFHRRDRCEGLPPWWLRHPEPALTVAVGLALTLFAAWLAQTEADRNQAEAFRQLAESRTAALAKVLRDLRDVGLEGLALFCKGNENVTAHEFRNYTEYLTRNRAVQAWEWIPAVPAADKKRFEQAAQAAGMENFEIWQNDASGNRGPAAGRKVYYPVFRVTPEEGNRAAIGFDLGSEPVRRAALQEALRTGFGTATEPVTLVQETGSQKGMLVFRPVFAENQRRQPLGLALAVLRLGDALEAGIPDDVVGKELILVRGDNSVETLASSWKTDNPPHAKLSFNRPIFAFGKTFVVAAHTGPKFLSMHPVRAGMSAALTGLLLTAALALVVSVLLRRRDALEGLVNERTTALRESEAHLSATLRSIGDGVIACDREGRVASLNRAAEILTGWTSAEAAGQPIQEVFRIIHAQTRETAENPVFRALAEGINVDLANHTALISKDGTEHQIADSCAPIRDASGVVTGAVLVFRDVTEQYRRREELRESEERLALATRGTGIGVWDYDVVEDRLEWDDQMFALFGVDHDAFAHRFEDWNKCVDPEALPKALDDFQRALEGGGDFSTEFPIVKPGGEKRWLSGAGIVTFDGQGQPLRVVGVNYDVTDRKRSEEAIRESEERFMRVLHASNDAILLIDGYRFVDCNEATVAMLGYDSREQFLQTHPLELSPETQPDGRGSREKADEMINLAAERGFHRFEWIYRRANGEEFPMEVSLTPIIHQGRNLLYCVWRDITELKRIERELEAFSAVIENSDNIIVMKDLNLRVVATNSAFAHASGHSSREELIGKTDAEIFGVSFDEEPIRTYMEDDLKAQALPPGEFLIREEPVVSPQGDTLTVLTKKYAVYDADGTLSGTGNISTDITERKRVEDELAGQTVLLRKIFDSFPGFIGLKDSSGRFVMANKGLSGHWGVAPEEMLGKTDVDLLGDSAEARQFMKDDREVIRSGREKLVSPEMVTSRDGQERWFTTLKLPFQRPGSAEKSLLIVATDITEQKRAQFALRCADVRTHALMESVQAGIVLVRGSDRVVVEANPAAARMVGVEVQNLVGKDCYEYICPAQAGRCPVLDLCQELDNAEQTIRRADGTIIPVLKTVTRIDFEGEEHLLESFVDITELQSARQNLEQTNEMLKEAIARANQMAVEAQSANVAKSQFLANMSHEIRTPMNGVVGMTDLLMGTELTDEQRQFAKVIKHSGDALLDLIDDILDFSKIEAGKLNLEIRDFDLQSLLDDFVATLVLQAHQKGLELVYGMAPDIPPLLRGDPGRLRQILANLTGNAVKFTHSGEVSIRVTLESDTPEDVLLRFSVADTGIGIPPKKQKVLFQKFSQADASTTRKYGGTGLGLAISKQLAEMMGGEIGVRSEAKKGSEFWFTVRLVKQPPQAAEKMSKLANLAGVRALIVDDNATNLDILKTRMESWDICVFAVSDGPSALEALKRACDENDPFRVAVIDMQMPGMDGGELGRIIKSDERLMETRMVLLTSLGVRGDSRRFKEIGFDAYLTKPARPFELKAVLSSILSTRTEGNPEPQGITTRRTVWEIRNLFADQRVRILLAEDNLTNQQVAMGILKQLGLRADAVADGRQALEALRAIPYDLVLMDVQMPEMDGLEATRQIRNPQSAILNRNIPVIAMTAHAMAGDREKCLNSGMNGYVSKPINPLALANELGKWIGKEMVETEQNDGLPEEDVSTNEEDGSSVSLIFDRAALLERLMDDEGLAETIIAVFWDDMPKQLAALRSYVENGQAEQAGDQAHKIKGAAGNIAALALQETASDMERAGKAGDMVSLQRLLPELEQRFLQLKARMESNET